MDVVAMGESGLKGWRRKAADPVAKAVAKRTSFSEAQIRAVIGGVFLALAVLAFARTVKDTLRAGREGRQPD